MCNLCEICEENEVWSEAVAHGKNWCEDCSHSEDCENQYHRPSGDAPRHPFWETDRDLCWCEKCCRSAQKESEMESLEAELRSLATANDWEIDRTQQAQTGSVYFTLSRECDCCVLGGDPEDCTCEKLSVRISDHGSCYCREDISLIIPSGNASGDDHSIETLKKRLVRVSKTEEK